MADIEKIRTKLPPHEVDPEHPFKGDALAREELCKKWTNLIAQSTTPYVMAIDGRWGDGKTTLLQMWKAYLNDKGFKCVLFDAWQADFYSHALPAIIGAITKEISSDNSSNKAKNISGKEKSFIKEAKNFSNEVKKIAKTLSEPDTALKVIAPIIPGGGAITEIHSAIKKLSEDHDAIEDYKKYQETVEKFKSLLQNFSAKISKENDDKPLVIFIDELDRCRPDFALDVLEKVKHVFNVESVFFIFAINKREIEKTIRTVYGKIDTASYLRKFFDLTINLINKKHLGEHALAKSGLKAHLQKREEWLKDKGYQSEEALFPFEQYWNAIIKRFNFSLRDEEQILSILNISFHTISNEQRTFSLVLAYFAVLKIVNPDLFMECRVSLHSENRIPFPHQKIIDFFRVRTSFNNSEDSQPKVLTNEDQVLYRVLCATRYQYDEEYQSSIDTAAQNTSDEGKGLSPQMIRRISNLYYGENYASRPNLIDFFETLDSISGFVFDADRER